MVTTKHNENTAIHGEQFQRSAILLQNCAYDNLI